MLTRKKSTERESRAELLRRFFLNPRTWYPVTEIAQLIGRDVAALTAELQKPLELAANEWRLRPDGVMEILHEDAVWRVFESCGSAEIEDALGAKADTVLHPGRRTELITVRLQRYVADVLRRDAKKRGRDLASEAAVHLSDSLTEGMPEQQFTLLPPKDTETPIYWTADSSVPGGFRRLHPDVLRGEVRS